MSNLTIIHFNDVYEVQGRDKAPQGGADRFSTMVKSYAHLNPLVLFSGDGFSPSTIGSITRGAHIPEVLNAIGVHYATLGNHDFDYGIPKLHKLKAACKFPWFLANIVDENDVPLTNALKSKLIEWNGVKVGLVGLAEGEWLDTLPTLPKTTKYIDQVEVGKALCAELKAEGAQIIIAITHSRGPNDIILAQGVPDIDIILGGHDHDYYIFNTNNTPILNSGCNFINATVVTVNLESNNLEKKEFVEEIKVDDADNWEIKGPNATFHLQKIVVDTKYEQDPVVFALVDKYAQIVEEKKRKILCISQTQLNAKFSVARSQENNSANFLSDIMRRLYDCEIGFLGGGTVRSDDVYGPGEITHGDMMNIFPFMDPCVVIEIKGKYVRDALENGFSKIPAMEGRFPQISGLWVVYDPTKEALHRVVEVYTGEAFDTRVPLEDERLYTLITKPFLLSGGDGYIAFTHRERILVAEDQGIPSFALIKNYMTMKEVASLLSKKEKINNLAAAAFIAKGKKLSPKPTISPQVEGRILTVQNYAEFLKSREKA